MFSKADLKTFKYVRKGTKKECRLINQILNDNLRARDVILKKTSFSKRIKYTEPRKKINFSRKRNPEHWTKSKFYEHEKKTKKTNEKNSKNATVMKKPVEKIKKNTADDLDQV